MRRKLACSAVGSLLSLGAIAAPVIYNNDVVSGRAAFDSTITGVGGTVQTLALSGLTSNASSWTLPGLTIRATDNTDRFVYGDYNGYRAAGRPYAVGGATIAIAPAVPASGSGLTFTFATPVNAFGLEIADWATCCTSVLHPDTGAPVGSNLFISFDGAPPASSPTPSTPIPTQATRITTATAPPITHSPTSWRPSTTAAPSPPSPSMATGWARRFTPAAPCAGRR